MVNINILSANSFRNSLMRYALMGVMALTTIGLYNGASSVLTNIEFSNRAKGIEEKVNSGNLEEASKALEAGKEKFFRPVDYARLRVDLDGRLAKKQGLEAFEQAISKGDAENVRVKINELRAKGLAKEEIEGLEKKAYESTEDGLILRIKSTKLSERPALAEQYLQIYPKGKQRKEAVQQLLMGYIQQTLSEIDERREINSLNLKIARLGLALDSYSNEGVYLGDILDQTTLTDKAKSAATNLFFTTTSDIGQGKEVVFLKKSENPKWYKEYVEQRGKTIPFGSLGKVEDIFQDNGTYSYIVRFPGVTNYFWGRDWTPDRKYWTNGVKNAATFKREEIGLAQRIEEIDRKLLLREIKELEVKLAPYFATQGQSSSQMHGRIITQIGGEQNAR